MARPIPKKDKTVKVQSLANVGGLAPHQIAEVDDSQQTRGLIGAGLWRMLVDNTVTAKAAPAPAPVEVVIDEEPVEPTE